MFSRHCCLKWYPAQRIQPYIFALEGFEMDGFLQQVASVQTLCSYHRPLCPRLEMESSIGFSVLTRRFYPMSLAQLSPLRPSRASSLVWRLPREQAILFPSQTSPVSWVRKRFPLPGFLFPIYQLLHSQSLPALPFSFSLAGPSSLDLAFLL